MVQFAVTSAKPEYRFSFFLDGGCLASNSGGRVFQSCSEILELFKHEVTDYCPPSPNYRLR